MKVNLNDTIKVKLTDLGKEIYYHQFDDVNKRGAKIEPKSPDVDEDGMTKFRLHHFIELYGSHIGIVKPNVIEPLDIELVIDNQTDREYIHECVERYNATELLHDTGYLNEDEYNRIVNSQLRTIIGRMAMILDEEDLDYWQQLPLVSNVLTTPHMGAWLLRRQGNIKKQIGERLCEIIARNVIRNESLGEDEDAKAYNQGLEAAMEIIKDYCEVNKDADSD